MGADEPYLDSAVPGTTPANTDGEDATTQTYVVVGPRPIGPFGAVAGESVDLTLTPDQQFQLIDAGHVVLAADYTPDPPVTDPVWD